MRRLSSRLLLAVTLTTSMAALSGAAAAPAGAAVAAGTSISVLQLGDSIASGEGTLYEAPNTQAPNGQLYFCRSASDPSSACHSYLYGYYNGYWRNWPSTEPGTWTPSGSPTYPECHQSPDAYGEIVAAASHASFTQLACSGATYLAGVTGNEAFVQGSVYSSAFLGPYTVGAPTGSSSVPPQFGDIATDGTPSSVNAAYTTAKPNVVLLTLGADDVKFLEIVTACLEWNYTPDAQSDPRVSSPFGTGYSGNLQCSNDNATDRKGPTGTDYPQGVIQDYFLGQLDTLHAHLTTLLTAIEKEGQQPGQNGPPKIVITNYPNPLPDSLPEKSGSDWAYGFCPDTFPLYNAEVDYFSGLVDQLDTQISQWVGNYQKTSKFGSNVAVVNLEKVDAGYQWCDDQNGNLSPSSHDLTYREPYAYGFSVNGTSTSLASYPAPAIFHPTIVGQQEIATCVKPAISALLGDRSSSAGSRIIRSLARGTYRIGSSVKGRQALTSC